MVQMPPYIRLIVDNTGRRDVGAVRSKERTSGEVKVSLESDGAKAPRSVDTVNLISHENRRAVSFDIPTALEAEEALKQLQSDLPNLGQSVGDVHSGLDRRVILSLLAPLVEG